MAESFDGLREYVGTRVRPPEFGVVQGRARRLRRRQTIIGAVAVVLLLLGLGYAVQAAPRRPAPPAVPSPTPTFQADVPENTNSVDQIVAGGPHDLYALRGNCFFCSEHLYFSADDGASWHRRTVPPATAGSTDKTRNGQLVALGPGLLAWTDQNAPDRSGHMPQRTDIPYEWISIDGGTTWRRPEVGRTPVAAIPPGTAAIGCAYAGSRSPCLIYAIDPATGRMAPLATQPAGFIAYPAAFNQDTAPVDAGAVYLSGVDPASRKPAIASTTDGGRTWQTTVLTAADPSPSLTDENRASIVWPWIRAGAGGAAYACEFIGNRTNLWYRTTDGGRNWEAIQGRPCTIGYVTPDGAYVYPPTTVTMVPYTITGYLISRNGSPWTPITISGPPGGQELVRQPALDLYVAPRQPSSFYLSHDGLTWRKVDVPF